MTRSKSGVRSSSRSKEPSNSDDVIVDVVDKKRIGGIDHFLVKWSKKSKKDSWEPASDVTKVAKSLIDKFELEQNKEAEYEVEKLVDRKRVKNGISYLVKWKGYGMDDCTWEDGASLPNNEIVKYEKQYGKIAPKKTKSDSKADEGESSPKKKKKAAKSPAKTEPSTDISVIKERKIINNVLHYTVKLVGQSAVKTLPIFEIEDVQAISDWEQEQFAAGFTQVSEETEYSVEKIITKRGEGKRAEYKVKWLGYPNSENTWEKLENLSGSKKLVAEFDKRLKEKELKLAEKDYEVEKIVDEKIYKKNTVYLVKWKGYKADQNTWEPEDNLKETAAEKIDQWQVDKVKKAQKQAERAAKRDEKKAERKAKKEAEKAAKKEQASKDKEAEADEPAGEDKEVEEAAETPADDAAPAEDAATTEE